MTGKVKKFPSVAIRKIRGGKDPVSVIEEFLARLGFDPVKAKKESGSDGIRWMIALEGGEELEVLLEGLRVPQETTVYLGINVGTVPLRNLLEVLTTALEIADGLVGIKLSLVGHFLVLSASMGAVGIDVDEVEYHYRLIVAQLGWFRNALSDELNVEIALSE
jgi:hypothetical protein